MSITFKKSDQLRPTKSPWIDDNGTISRVWYGWLKQLHDAFNANASALAPNVGAGLSVTIVTEKLTVGGANGSMTFTNGVLTAQTPAT